MNQSSRSVMFSLMLWMIFFSEAPAISLSEEKWSFAFDNVSIQDAFNKIGTETGIEFVVNNKTPDTVMVTYHKDNQSIQQICRELLRDINYVSSLEYAGNGDLKSIQIVIIGCGAKAAQTPIANAADHVAAPKEIQEKPKETVKKEKKPAPPAVSRDFKNLKTNMPPPPAPPNIPGLEAPPSPPGG